MEVVRAEKPIVHSLSYLNCGDTFEHCGAVWQKLDLEGADKHCIMCSEIGSGKTQPFMLVLGFVEVHGKFVEDE